MKTDALSFEMDFTGLQVATTYNWKCKGTSLNPNMDLAAYSTETVEGTVTTKAAPAPEPTGGDGDDEEESESDSALLSSLFAAVLMIVAVFFY